MQIPQWNRNHGVEAINLRDAVGISAGAAKKGTSVDDSGLANGNKGLSTAITGVN